MRRIRRLNWLLASMVASASAPACGGPSAFSCEDASACVSGSQVGFCEANGYCSFPDDACPSGRRYGEHAVTGLAGQCVPLDDATDTALDSTTTHGNGSEGSTSLETGSTAAPTSTTTPMDTTGDPTDPTVSSADDDTSHGTTTGQNPVEVEIPADIAECTDPVQLDPVACAAVDGGNSLNVDAYDNAFEGPTTAWLRFPIPQELMGLEITSVTLRLVVTNDSNANGDAAGEVWSVTTFDLATLTESQPSPIELLAESFGPVRQGDVVQWSLPVTALAMTPLHLGIIPVSQDGVNYWNNKGTDPPVLIVEAQ